MVRVLETTWGIVNWSCNFCEAENSSEWLQLEREGPSCRTCGSSVRQRHIRHVLEQKVLKIERKKLRPLRILGLSDATLIEDYLSGLRGVRYKNTFFDVRPRLDITNPSIFLRGSADILISSDVLEHVFFPVSKALDGHSTVLKRGGLLILTVPYTTQFENQEHFPWMVSYQPIQLESGRWIVRGFEKNGGFRDILNPIFHGGPGNTLEMRLLSLEELIRNLSGAGFTDIEFHDSDLPEIGVRVQLAVITAKSASSKTRRNR